MIIAVLTGAGAGGGSAILKFIAARKKRPGDGLHIDELRVVTCDQRMVIA